MIIYNFYEIYPIYIYNIIVFVFLLFSNDLIYTKAVTNTANRRPVTPAEKRICLGLSILSFFLLLLSVIFSLSVAGFLVLPPFSSILVLSWMFRPSLRSVVSDPSRGHHVCRSCLIRPYGLPFRLPQFYSTSSPHAIPESESARNYSVDKNETSEPLSINPDNVWSLHLIVNKINCWIMYWPHSRMIVPHSTPRADRQKWAEPERDGLRRDSSSEPVKTPRRKEKVGGRRRHNRRR